MENIHQATIEEIQQDIKQFVQLALEKYRGRLPLSQLPQSAQHLIQAISQEVMRKFPNATAAPDGASTQGQLAVHLQSAPKQVESTPCSDAQSSEADASAVGLRRSMRHRAEQTTSAAMSTATSQIASCGSNETNAVAAGAPSTAQKTKTPKPAAKKSQAAKAQELAGKPKPDVVRVFPKMDPTDSRLVQLRQTSRFAKPFSECLAMCLAIENEVFTSRCKADNGNHFLPLLDMSKIECAVNTLSIFLCDRVNEWNEQLNTYLGDPEMLLASSWNEFLVAESDSASAQFRATVQSIAFAIEAEKFVERYLQRSFTANLVEDPAIQDGTSSIKSFQP